MKKKKGVIYVRISTDKDEQKSSLEIQEESLKNICESKNIEIIETYADKASGTRIRKRNGFIEMLYDGGIDFKIRNDRSADDFTINKDRKPRFDYIICKDIFRFGRNSNEAMQVIKELKDNGVIVYFINSAVDTSADDYKMRLELLFTIAENESHNTSRRIRFSKRHLAQNGKYSPARLPYGYKRIIDKNGEKQIVIDEEQATIVKLIFNKYYEMGGNKLSNLLNNEGVLTQQGHQWSNDKITRIINNTCYYGSPIVQKWTKADVTDMYFHKADVSHHIQLDNVIPAIITKNEFEVIQSIKKSRTNSNSNKGKYNGKDDIFYEKVFCIQCGSRFVRHMGYKNKTTYMCQKRRKYSVKSCDCKGIAYNNLVNFVNQSQIRINDLRHGGQLMHLNKNIKKAILERKLVIEDIQQKIIQIKNKIEAITDSFIDANSTMRKSLNKKMEQCESEIVGLSNQIEQLNITDIEQIKQNVQQKEIVINKLRKKKEYSFDEKIKLLKKIEVGADFIEVIFISPDYDDEIERFNQLFRGTELEIKLCEPIFLGETIIRNKQLIEEQRESILNYEEAPFEEILFRKEVAKHEERIKEKS
ncbi:recombinase family protein [Viridibacillus sp. FSL R5-0477]|uniref:Phage integrase family site-specific recombinase n=1 Tax=Viridibacillus arenosi FSL R5-213 TaxID=1227360 RepID=W4EQG3_9BACL|nr:recombinase family protein [Viridibacillus arenosi]ETT82247.1 phage integrase family site-specific recombinase [Viridibacillus arenosi FSL R5-213]OMC92648.1 recombinase family protein [Viridibacillus arenosi]